MYKRGSQLMLDSALQALGINNRDDLDTLCHRELRLEINTYLHLCSIRSGLVWVAANPDGERRRSLDPLCFWYPKATALSLIADLLAPKPDSFESMYRKYADYTKRFRAAQHVKRQEKTAAREGIKALTKTCLVVKRLERNTYLWWLSLEIEELIWVMVNPYNERRKDYDAQNLWFPKDTALKCLSKLHNPAPRSFEEDFTEVSSYFTGFRTATEMKIALVKEQLRIADNNERQQLLLKGC